jgi:phage terminase Nu1 subunit (DNA packaging protein)
MSEELFTVYRLSKLLDVDRHMLPRILHRYKVEPATGDAATKLYTLDSAADAVRRYKAEPETQGTEANYKTEVARERARKLKIENDAKEKHLIAKAAVAAEIQRVAAGVNSVRIRAEQEWPRLFAAAGDSIPANSEVLRQMLDDMFTKFAELGKVLND